MDDKKKAVIVLIDDKKKAVIVLIVITLISLFFIAQYQAREQGIDRACKYLGYWGGHERQSEVINNTNEWSGFGRWRLVCIGTERNFTGNWTEYKWEQLS